MTSDAQHCGMIADAPSAVCCWLRAEPGHRVCCRPGGKRGRPGPRRSRSPVRRGARRQLVAQVAEGKLTEPGSVGRRRARRGCGGYWAAAAFLRYRDDPPARIGLGCPERETGPGASVRWQETRTSRASRPTSIRGSPVCRSRWRCRSRSARRRPRPRAPTRAPDPAASDPAPWAPRSARPLPPHRPQSPPHPRRAPPAPQMAGSCGRPGSGPGLGLGSATNRHRLSHAALRYSGVWVVN
jgi:hypothetical protein